MTYIDLSKMKLAQADVLKASES